MSRIDDEQLAGATSPDANGDGSFFPEPRAADSAADSGAAQVPGGQLTPSGGEASGVGSLGRLVWGVFSENKLALVGVGVALFMILFSFLGPFFYHTNQTSVIVSAQNYYTPPSAAHLLGTDPNGYDELGRIMVAGRTTLEICLIAAALATAFGVIYGAISGFLGGVIDAVMMRIVDVMLSIPSLFLLIVIAAIYGTTFWLLVAIVALVAWLAPARLIRGETLTLRTREYVQAVRSMGGKNWRIIWRHIVPNAIGTVIVNATFQIADAVGVLAALGYLGYFLPGAGSWGQMLYNGITYIEAPVSGWWLVYPVGICIILVVVAFNFIGDALRDSFEVRLQRR